MPLIGAQREPLPGGQFYRAHWYERGMEHANPKFASSVRVNSPETSTGRFAGRREARENGLAVILMEEDLLLLDGVELYMEVWGGHPGTAKKRVSVNGRSTYPLPDDGVAEGRCAFTYPLLPLALNDVVNGYNALQFACDQGTTFWGHFMVDNAVLLALLNPTHPDIKSYGLADFNPVLRAETASDAERITLELDVPESVYDHIDMVHFQGRYRGYNENGSMQDDVWHGITKDRQPVAMLGKADSPPYRISWDVSMLPDQQDMAVRAHISFKEQDNLHFRTAALEGLATPERAAHVSHFRTTESPVPFWSRAGREKTGVIDMPIPPEQIERAVLHMAVWDGGRGSIEHPVLLNGHPVEVAGSGKHEKIYRVLELDPDLLIEGANTVTVISDTEHHGIEVLLPEPALMVRYPRKID